MLKQFGKPSAALIMQKTSFFEENDLHVSKQKDIAEIYSKQPLRLQCKNCDSLLNTEADFRKDGIDYKVCRNCSHLNGANEDTSEFCEAIYSTDDKTYAENYDVKDISAYEYRTSSIYMPKAEFLYTTLKANQSSPSELSYFDYGAGTGYFVSALKKLGLRNVSGSEVSACQVEQANTILNDNLLSCHSIHDNHKMLKETKANVISMIGVLEHLQTPRAAMAAISANDCIEYVFLSVPLFSLSVYLELLDDTLFHRQLHGGHTHLYTEESLGHLCQEFKFDIIGQWWFGTDAVDLYRLLNVNLERKDVSSYVKDHLKANMTSFIDQVQLEIDKQKKSSEVHLVLRKKS